MKKFVTALSLSILAMFATQGAYANNAQKTAVVKKFLDCSFQDKCRDNNSSNGVKKFLSQSALVALKNEEYHHDAASDEECGAVVPRCYSGLWTIPGQDWHDSLVKKTTKISVAKNGVVVAKFQIVKGSPVTAYFKVIKENGQYKIDNTTQAWEESHKSWWR